ncbi:MAG: phosphohistidine phosphatase SixA [Myxococcota bacterium]
MELYVLRHAIAAEPEGYARDADRPLTQAGIDKLRKVTRAFDPLGVEVDVILSSPYVRARHTAAIAGEALGVQPILDGALSAGATPKDFVGAIKGHAAPDQRVMVVGHEPDLSRLVTVLCGGLDGSGVRMKKAGLAKLAVERLRARECAQLQWLLWPKHMLRMA